MAVGIERHELNEPKFVVLLTGKRCEIFNARIVHTTNDHSIDFHRVESDTRCGLEAFEHPFKFGAAATIELARAVSNNGADSGDNPYYSRFRPAAHEN